MEFKDWSWFFRKIENVIDPIMAQHGFKLVYSSEGQLPEIQEDETDADGAGVFYENDQETIIVFDVIWDDDVLFFRANPFYFLRGDIRGIKEGAFKDLISPQPILPEDTREYHAWKCRSSEEVEQWLNTIAEWLSRNLSTFLK